MSTDWRAELEQRREQKREYFANHPHSPVPDDEHFAGLDYYAIDPAYRFEVPLDEYDEKELITVETTADSEQEYVRWGEFSAGIGDAAVTLQAYKPESDEDRLWVPFRDETNGETTYDAGRYIDLEPEEHGTGDGWLLDFNAAYNPICAYNKAYECPLIPMENWLDVRLEAGEKDYPGEPVEPSHRHH